LPTTNKKAPIIDRKLLDYIGENPCITPYEWVIRLQNNGLLPEGIDAMRLREQVISRINRMGQEQSKPNKKDGFVPK
jgi:hypothetical protein